MRQGEGRRELPGMVGDCRSIGVLPAVDSAVAPSELVEALATLHETRAVNYRSGVVFASPLLRLKKWTRSS